MSDYSKWIVSDLEKEKKVGSMTNNLSVLRTKIDISQEKMAKILGVSRQTYSSIELGKRKMSWQLYLALVKIFDTNEETHDLMRYFGCYPDFFEEK